MRPSVGLPTLNHTSSPLAQAHRRPIAGKAGLGNRKISRNKKPLWGSRCQQLCSLGLDIIGPGGSSGSGGACADAVRPLGASEGKCLLAKELLRDHHLPRPCRPRSEPRKPPAQSNHSSQPWEGCSGAATLDVAGHGISPANPASRMPRKCRAEINTLPPDAER